MYVIYSCYTDKKAEHMKVKLAIDCKSEGWIKFEPREVKERMTGLWDSLCKYGGMNLSKDT